MTISHYASRQRQQQHAADFRLSGLTRTQYADLHNLSRSSFNRWLARCPPTEHQETLAAPFIPVSMSSLPSNIATVTINLSRCSITCQPGQLPAILKELNLC
ncbi:MAG: IS66 family insertion sequence element accessory protein TnpA [Serratia sp. (in: enterobacteria)]|uniref:IS66 family insertion sequence element accessory protein TnpA n=1 Tax=Serratia sp. (in: enterobacteria) TaxID=616 RepID=UPI003F35D259